MDQKNTIVKCHQTTCLYNYHGTCDQYMIIVDDRGYCESYIETENKPSHSLQGQLNICHWCDYFNSRRPVKQRCSHPNPLINDDTTCSSIKSTGGNR